MILGYVEQPSPRAGESLTLRVSTDAPAFRVRFFRCGADIVECGHSDWFPGEMRPLHLPFQDWGRANVGLAGETLLPWPAYRLDVPAQWSSGVYVAELVEADDRAAVRNPVAGRPDAREARALFVVRPTAPSASLLYKVPVHTYQAYNLVHPRTYDPTLGEGSWCLYNMPSADDVPVAFPEAVGLHRPGGGIGGAPYDVFNHDPFDPTPRQTFVHWDARMIGWLEGEGYTVDYCTDVDLHRLGEELLSPYRLLVSAGHDEYWSSEMRDAVESFRGGGGNVAFFAGNVAWWQIRFHTDVSFSRERFWCETDRPENTLTGVSFRNGGERDRDEHPVPVGYRVQNTDHWVFSRTGLSDGDVIGGGPEEYLVGYECDGADFDRTRFGAGAPAVPSRTDGTPQTFTILGVGDTRPSGWGNGNGAATMGVFTDGGTVFTAGTTDWPRVLTDPVPAALPVAQITRNVLDRFLA